jgi:hypothetical protein
VIIELTIILQLRFNCNAGYVGWRQVKGLFRVFVSIKKNKKKQRTIAEENFRPGVDERFARYTPG